MEALAAVTVPLLQALETLGFVARNFHPPLFPALMKQIGTPDEVLRANVARLSELPERYAGVGAALETSAGHALQGFERLREADMDDLRSVFRALRKLPAALEAVYPLAGILPPVNRFFLEPEARTDETVQKRFMRVEIAENAGVMHVEEGRGGFSLYVPEDYSDDREWPLVMALHGGSGDGPRFLWSWLAAARTHGAILVAPSSVGGTWAIQGDDRDSPNLARVLAWVKERWRIDETRLLLTGMSDGGTFSYVSGLDRDSPFTHLAPVSAAFHPMFAAMSDMERMKDLPIHIVHGVLDWMFPFAMARGAAQSLARAGAAVNYVELEDLSHTWPREIGARVLGWVDQTAG
jgi:phospholipase/carboxylesterase